MEYIENIKEISFITEIIKTYFITMCTYYINLKISNQKLNKNPKNILVVSIGLLLICVIYAMLRKNFGNTYAIIFLAISESLIFSIESKNEVIYSIVITCVSLSINYILFFTSVVINFIYILLLKISNEYIDTILVLSVYVALVQIFQKIKRFKKGFAFLKSKIENEYFNIIILNVSLIILFILIIAPDYSQEIARKVLFTFIFFSIMMFITIQKSLQLYYRQKQLIKNLEETKKELEEKKKEVQELEQENLKFSEKSHSIAFQQKALEHKIEMLELKNEIGEENEIKERLNEISKKFAKKEAVALTKTGITRVDDMLNYMQAECIKNEIDFQLQINGNIHHMTNKYLEKEELEILLATI